nr:hypothetical protein Itr_chr05CG16120 [Ipomoea trifida]
MAACLVGQPPECGTTGTAGRWVPTCSARILVLCETKIADPVLTEFFVDVCFHCCWITWRRFYFSTVDVAGVKFPPSTASLGLVLLGVYYSTVNAAANCRPWLIANRRCWSFSSEGLQRQKFFAEVAGDHGVVISLLPPEFLIHPLFLYRRYHWRSMGLHADTTGGGTFTSAGGCWIAVRRSLRH